MNLFASFGTSKQFGFEVVEPDASRSRDQARDGLRIEATDAAALFPRGRDQLAGA